MAGRLAAPDIGRIGPKFNPAQRPRGLEIATLLRL